MNIKEYIPSLITLIKKAQKDPSLELEVVLKHQISQEIFDNVIKKVKGIPHITLQSSSESLDVFIENSNLRVSVLGSNSIARYCKTNQLSELNERNYIIMKKTKSDSVDINKYNLRFNLKREDKAEKEIISKWDKQNKFFRYKKRFSYITSDKLFSFDFTVLKSSNKIITNEKNYKKKKGEVSTFMKKFVVKPRNIKHFEDWWDTLGASDMVELMGKKKHDFRYTKTFEGSGVLENDIDYEIELEWLGNNISYKEKHEIILDKVIQHTGLILQGIQKSNFIISSIEKKMVLDEYKKLMGTTRFSAPQNITLEHKHIIRHSYIDYKQLFSIRRNYSVTEKADGERNLCIVMENSEVFLINRKSEIKPLGCSIKGLENSILDGELILKDKSNKNIILFAVFDIYFYNNTDTKNRVFNRTSEEKTDGKLEQSREEILTDIFKQINVVSKDDKNNIMFIKKQFYYGNQDKYRREQDEEITKLESELKMADQDSTLYTNIKNNIDSLKQDSAIFVEAKKVLEKEYIYKIDGVVFTPVNLVIGDEMDDRPPKFDGRWNKLFKWKPPEENTIDFRVSIKQEDGEDEIRYSNLNGIVVSYKILILHVGYSSERHTSVNACRVMNEGLDFSKDYSMVPFQPFNPYIKNIEFAYIPVKNNVIFTENRQKIISGMIIEFSYDKRLGEGFCWKPLRVRNNNSPNDFVTAINVWRSIHYPITYEMITTGKTIDSEEEVYYFSNIDRKKLFTRPLADFHSYIKKQIISKNSKKNDKLIDFACGKGGDINHWVDSKISSVVGIDVNRDNLENIDNGLCNRVLTMRKKNSKEILKNILAVWADSSKSLSTGVAAKDDLNRYYLDIVYGNAKSELIKSSKLRKFYKMAVNGFDIASSQFSFHYFFENSVKLDIFLTNVSECLRIGGRFVGTCLDGRKVYELLRGVHNISVHENDKLIWKLSKLYDGDFKNDSSCVGMPIDVYVESIGNTTTEWLVNFEYLRTKSLEYGLALREVRSFEDYFADMNKNKIKYGDAKRMNDKLKQYSFLNTVFVFEKKDITI